MRFSLRISAFVLIIYGLVLATVMTYQLSVYKVGQEAKALKNKASRSSSPGSVRNVPKTSIEGNTIGTSSPQVKNYSAGVGCINFDASTRTITVSCSTPTGLTDVDNKLHDSNVLVKQSPAGVWFLNANLVIAKGATFHIDSTDTKWLKISSKVTTRTGATNTTFPAYAIEVHGSLRIDSIKITSWDPTRNNYAITNGSRTGAGNFIFGAPRPVITVESDATGTTNLTNSEIAYLGFERGKHLGDSGLTYSGGSGSIIKNDIIRELYFGLYTFGVGHMIIENNIIRNSGHYGLDPHTGTHDMIIRNNTIYGNNGSGIICSLNCYNILIENNTVHDNEENGIDFSRNMTNSIARYNIVYNEPSGIFISQSHSNQIYNNAISRSGTGINVNSGSSNNRIFRNAVSGSINNAILIATGSSDNTFTSNKISGPTSRGVTIDQDPTSKNNVFSNNQIIHSSSTTPATTTFAIPRGSHNKQ